MKRYEVYDCNKEVMESFDDHLDALDYYNDNNTMFVYDCEKNKIVEGSDE